MLFMMVIFPNKVNPLDVQMLKLDFTSLRIGKRIGRPTSASHSQVVADKIANWLRTSAVMR